MAKVTKWIEASPAEYTADVAVRGLRSRFASLQYYLVMAACKPEEDIEYVHQLRTWSRRATAAACVFEEFLPPRRARWLNKQLRRIRRASNDARDDDVFAARLAKDSAQPDALRLLARVRAHRASAQPPLVDVYRRLSDNRRLEKRLTKLLKRVRWRGADSERGTPQFGTWAVQRLRGVVDEFFVASADLTTTEALHQFRIWVKRLRYTMELLGGAFQDALQAEVYPLTVSLQDKLGELNDFTTAQQRLENWIELSTSAEDVAYLQTLLTDAQTRWEQSRTAFFVWWTPERQQQLRERFDRLLGDRPPQASCA